ncbi:hypothetical protein DFJ77DRAFT_477010 [Powellomyces hirtus]|nr:hypothetical protein DFJ77DRAFT_477010 [Powellomyces hirtus]
MRWKSARVTPVAYIREVYRRAWMSCFLAYILNGEKDEMSSTTSSRIPRSVSSPTSLAVPNAIGSTGDNSNALVHSGYLWKRSKTHPQRWMRRHFRFDGRVLAYHHSSSTGSAARLSLETSRIMRVVASPRPVAGIGVNVFDIWITGGDPPLEVAARTRRGMEEWVTILSRAVGARWLIEGTGLGTKRRATVGESAAQKGHRNGMVTFKGIDDAPPVPPLPERRSSGPADMRAKEGDLSEKPLMPTLPPLPFSLEAAFGKFWDSEKHDVKSNTPVRNDSKPVPQQKDDHSAKTPIAPERTLGSRPKVPSKTGTPPSLRRPNLASQSMNDLVTVKSLSSESVSQTIPRTTSAAKSNTKFNTAPSSVAKNHDNSNRKHPMDRFKSAEKLQALIVALHDSMETARPDALFNAAEITDRLMRDLPPLPTHHSPPPQQTTTTGPTAKPVREAPMRILPPVIITNPIPAQRLRNVPAQDSADSTKTITRPGLPSPTPAPPVPAIVAVTRTERLGSVGGAAQSPLLTSLDPQVAPSAQRVAVLSKVVDIVRHGTALHLRLNREEEGDRDNESSGSESHLSRKDTKTSKGSASPALPSTHLAARTKARRKALDEYRVAVEDLGRRTRDYIRSLPSSDNADSPAVAPPNPGAATAAAVDLVESVEVMLMKLAQLREVFADRV